MARSPLSAPQSPPLPPAAQVPLNGHGRHGGGGVSRAFGGGWAGVGGHPDQAKSAILYLCKSVLQIDLHWLDKMGQAKTLDEVRELLSRMQRATDLIAQLLYRTGMRLMEALWLPAQDVEFSAREVTVREAARASTNR